MKCQVCGRTLQEDARYCDYCGANVPDESQEETTQTLNKRLLVTSILASLGITVVITLIAMGFGIPLFIGGLFLPFFFVKKKVLKRPPRE